jgi:CHAD domain-containing protein
MSYELRRDEEIGEGLRRLCRKQIESALAIVAGEHEPDDTPVHETRKHLKKARAALRIARKEIGRGLFKRQDHLLRDVGRLISDIRDAEVRLQTVRQLQGITQRQRHRSYHKVEEMLMLELENFLAAYAEWQAQALPMLTQARDEIDNWSVTQLGPRQLRAAVQETYKCGRDTLAEAKASLAPEDFHAFRGEAKQLWYQLRILRPVNSVVLKNLSDELHALGDLLGRAHDLSFLGDRLRKERGRSAFNREGQELMAVIEASGSDLQRSACELAERFFAERPRDFGARVASWLSEWANEKSDSLAGELISDGGQRAALV